MTDQPSEQLPVSSESATSEEFDLSSSNLVFPRLDLRTSFEALLNSSDISIPSSSAMDGPARGPSSLSESWASISDAELSLDEDLHSEHTDLGSLIDLHSTGDIQSVRDDETSSEAIETEEDEEDEHIECQRDSAIKHPIQTPMNSSRVEEGGMDGGHLTLNEVCDVPAGESMIATKIVKTFSQNECRVWKIPLESEFVGKMRMPLGKNIISDEHQQTFRALLFRPQIPSDLHHAILHKLADAQLASGSGVDIDKRPSPSRYHIVPDAIGPGSQPAAAAIVPVDRQLETVHYETAGFDPDPSRTIWLGDRGNSRRTVSIWEGASSRDTGLYHLYGAQMEEPDLAIVLIDDQKEAKNREFALASLAFARRHGVPAIAIRLHDDWLSNPALSGFIEDDLHITVQGTSGSDDPIIRTLPIDTDMFLNLNPDQLSRHIRYLMQQRACVPGPPQSKSKSPAAKHTDIEKNVQHDGHVKRTTKQGYLHFLILALCGLFLLHGLAAVQMRWGIMRSSLASENGVVEYLQTYSEALSTASIHSHTLSKDVAVATTGQHPSANDRPLTAKKKFEVEIVGHSHLVVRAAREYRVQDPLEVSITRQGKPLKADIRVLFPSVWSVQLETEQAYGDLCVRLSMKRPAINETVVVNMGQQPFDAWFKNLLDETEEHLQQKLALLQDSLENLQRQQRPRNLVKNVQAKLSEMMQQANLTLRSPELQDRALELKQAFLKQMEAGVALANGRAAQFATELKKVVHVSSDRTELLMEQFGDSMERMRTAFEDLHVGDRVTDFWRTMQEGPKSETLARAQDRAQHVFGEIRERIGKPKI